MDDRCSVKLCKADGEALVKTSGAEYRISMADFLKSGIEDGAPCGESALLFLEEAAEKLRCIKKAFVYLSYGDLPRRKLGQKLKKAGFTEREIEKTLSLLTERGYLDDAALCKARAFSLKRCKLFGPARIKKELYAKGFDKSCVDTALEALQNGGDDDGEAPDNASCIKELLGRRFPSLSPEDRQGRAKAVSYLYGMGYSYDDINNVISALGRD